MPTTLPNGTVVPDPLQTGWGSIIEDDLGLLDDALGTLAGLGNSATRDVGTGSGDVAAGNAPATAASAAVTTHVGESDPHAQYLTEANAAALYAPITALGSALSRHIPLTPLLFASEGSVMTPLVTDGIVTALTVRVQPQTTNDGSNYWELHCATGRVELASTDTSALAADEWATIVVSTEEFLETDVTVADDEMIALWWTAVGTPGELVYAQPMISVLSTFE